MASEQQQQQQQQQPSQTQQNNQQNAPSPSTQQSLSRSSPQQQQQQIGALPQQQQHSALPQQTELLSHASAPERQQPHIPPPAVGAQPNVLEQQQQFCLRWNNFQSNIVNSFESLLNKEELVDVTLTAEGKSLRAHRVLLSACSPYFSDLFKDLPSHQHPVIVLRDTRFLELKCLLCFIYHGEVNVSQDNLSCLLNLAENLKVKGLAQEAPKRHNSKDYEYGGRRGLSPEREEDLSDGGEGLTPKHRGRLLRSEESNSPSPAPHTGFPSYPALGNLLGPKSSVDDRNTTRDLRDSHMSKGQSVGMVHDRHQALMHQERQQQQAQQYSPPSKRRKRLSSPHQGQSPGGHNSTSSQAVQQSSCGTTNQSSSRGLSQVSPPPTNPSMHNNSSSSSAHTPSAEETNSHAVNLTVCQGSPPRLMIPKVEFIPSEEDSGNGDKERLERQEQRERLCNFLDKERIAGLIPSKFSGGADSDLEGEEEPPPPHHDEDSGDMDSHTSSGGLPHPLSHQLPPGLQGSFVPYPQTTHAAAAAAAAAAAHHIANTFTPGPSGVASSVSPGGWRSSHSSEQTPSSPQGTVTGDTMSALENLVDSLASEVVQSCPSEGPPPEPKCESSPRDVAPATVCGKSLIDRSSFKKENASTSSSAKLGAERVQSCVEGSNSIATEMCSESSEIDQKNSGIGVVPLSRVQLEPAENDPDTIMEELDIIAKEESLDLDEELDANSTASVLGLAESAVKSEKSKTPKNNASKFLEKSSTDLHQSKMCETEAKPKEPQSSKFSLLPSEVTKDNFFRQSLFKNSIEISPVSSCVGRKKNAVARKSSFTSSQSFSTNAQTVAPSASTLVKEGETVTKSETDATDDTDDLVIIDDKNKIDVDPLLFLADTPILSSSDSFDVPLYPTDSNTFFSQAAGSSATSHLPHVAPHAEGTSSIALCPSRQSCLCPLCGRLMAQRRSLKQHLMSSFHKLTLLEAEITVKTCNFSSQR